MLFIMMSFALIFKYCMRIFILNTEFLVCPYNLHPGCFTWFTPVLALLCTLLNQMTPKVVWLNILQLFTFTQYYNLLSELST